MLKHSAHFMNKVWLSPATGDQSIKSTALAATTTLQDMDSKKAVCVQKQTRVKTCLKVVNKSVSQRKVVEDFIKSQYRHHFEANLLTFFPAILTVHCQQSQKLLGALGLRYADQSQLFSEQYLSAPIEQLIAAKTHSQVERDDIIELGHFALLKPRYLTPVINALAGFIKQLDSQWAIYTLSTPIKKIFDKLAIETTYLAAAEACQLKGDTNLWGHYYKQQPAVYYSHVQTAMQSDKPLEESIESA